MSLSNFHNFYNRIKFGIKSCQTTDPNLALSSSTSSVPSSYASDLVCSAVVASVIPPELIPRVQGAGCSVQGEGAGCRV